MAERSTRKRSSKDKNDSIIPIEGRMPPQSIDLEGIVLGAILQEKDAFARVSEMLTPESFYLKAHEEVYRAMTLLAMNQEPIDMATVAEKLRSLGKLEEVGGVSFIASLTMRVLSSSSLEYHAKIVADKAQSRRLIAFASNVLQDAYADEEKIEEQMQRAEGKLFELATTKDSKDFQELDPLVQEAINEIQVAFNRVEGISGLSTGFDGIDEITSGWQKSDLIIIAARPAMGKTAFVVSMATAMAFQHKIPVALFNLEMSAVQLVKRILSNVCEIDGQTLKSGRLKDPEWKRLLTKSAELNEVPLYINDTPSLSVFELRSKARRLVREHGVELIIIDYLQLMNASGMGFGNREQEVSMISRNLKMLAKELRIPIIALSQLNRGVENRQGDANSKRPQLSDLRESGAIEQDADIVCFIHRPEYYKITRDPNTDEDLRGIGEFIIAKHRNGPIGDVRMRFKSEYAKFMNLEDGGVANTLKQKNTQEGYTQVAFGSNTAASNKQLAGTNGATMANTNPDFDNPGDSPF
jgi:replicative DNA helicase